MVWWDSFLVELLYFHKFLDPSEVVLGKSKRLGLEMFFSRKPSTCGCRQENSSRDCEGILRHPSLVWFCDLRIGLGEITVAWGWRWFNLWIPLVVYLLVYPMRSHIYDWNMEWGWLDERKIWFNPIYGHMVRGGP